MTKQQSDKLSAAMHRRRKGDPQGKDAEQVLADALQDAMPGYKCRPATAQDFKRWRGQKRSGKECYLPQ